MSDTMFMAVRCGKHGAALLDNECGQCLAEREQEAKGVLDTLSHRAPHSVVYSSVPNGLPPTVDMGDQIVPYEHGTTYLEYDNLPAELEEEIVAFITQKWKQHQRTCMCFRCQQRRAKEG